LSRNLFTQADSSARARDHVTLGVHELRVEIDTAIPLDGIEGNVDATELFSRCELLENTETEVRLHIQHALFAVIELDREAEIL
jgi:hypothetical protein